MQLFPFINQKMADTSGFEPETSSLEGCCSIQLSYASELLNMVVRAGLEPASSALWGQRTNQLCYRTVVALAGLEPATKALSRLCSTAELQGSKWRSIEDLNPWPPRSKRGTLSTELMLRGAEWRTRTLNLSIRNAALFPVELIPQA